MTRKRKNWSTPIRNPQDKDFCVSSICHYCKEYKIDCLDIPRLCKKCYSKPSKQDVDDLLKKTLDSRPEMKKFVKLAKDNMKRYNNLYRLVYRTRKKITKDTRWVAIARFMGDSYNKHWTYIKVFDSHVDAIVYLKKKNECKRWLFTIEDWKDYVKSRIGIDNESFDTFGKRFIE